MAPLQKQVVSFPLAGGVDTKNDPKQIDAPNFAVLENCDFNSIKQLSQKKGHLATSRNMAQAGTGFATALPTNTLLEISARDSKPVVRDSGLTFEYSSATAQWSNAQFGQISVGIPAALTMQIKRTVIDSGNSPVTPGIQPGAQFATDGSLDCYASVNTEGPFVTIRDHQTNAVIAQFDPSNTSQQANCHVFNTTDYFVIVVSTGTDKVIRFNKSTRTFDVQNHTYSMDPTLGASSWRAQPTVFNDEIYIFMAEAGSLRLKKVSAPYDSAAWAAAANYTVGGSAGAASVSVYNDGVLPARVFVFRSNSTNRLVATALNTSLTVVAGPNTILGGGPTGEYQVYSRQVVSRASWDLAPAARMYVALVGQDGTAPPWEALTYEISYNATLVSSAFRSTPTNNVNINLPILAPAFTNNNPFTIFYNRNLNLYQVTRLISGSTPTVRYPSASFGVFPACAYNQVFEVGNKVVFLVTENTAPRVDASFNYGTQLIKYELFGSTIDAGPSIEVNKTLFSPNGTLCASDGAKSFECAFTEAPTISALAAAGAIPAGTYQYTAIATYVDANGNLYRSFPSVPVSLTFGVASTVTITYTAPRISGLNQYNLEFYRTTNLGTNFYLVAVRQVGNETTNTVVDTTNDTTLQSRQLLYTTGGVLENAPPPPCNFALFHQNRVFVIDAEDTDRVAYTKKVQALTAPEFNEDLQLRAPVGNGGLVALGSLDDKLILFKRDLFFVVAGDGPTDLGTQNTFSEPQRVETDVGCITPRGLVNTPEGILFKSRRGWYWLTRSLTTQYIGAPVERFNALQPVDSCLIAERNQVRVYLSDGTVLVFDYILKQWSTQTIGVPLRSATVVNGKPWLLTNEATQRILLESDTEWYDGGAYQAIRITTPWIALNQIQGFQRIYKAVLLGELRARHSIRVRIGFDYDPTWKQEDTIDSQTAGITQALTDTSYYTGSTVTPGGPPAPMLQYDIRPYIQKCQAIRFEFTVLNTQNLNQELVRLSSLALVVGGKPKTARLNASRVVGA